ncbi:MAG: VWA domain-containing protein [Clostridiales bacterium]|nr:VWA domain-containing protein [Clostridiales bacterium]
MHNTKKTASRRKTALRGIAFFVILALSVTGLPFGKTLETAYALAEDTRVADPDSKDTWKDYFGPDKMTTEFAGGIWTDKSVYTDASAFSDVSMGDGNDSFLVALSAIASNESVTGEAYSPTDTMLILDLSSSMYSGNNTVTVPTMLRAVNDSITKLQTLNPLNRVGVCIYYGGPTVTTQATKDHSMVLLPLDRYKENEGKYLTYTTQSNKMVSVQVNSGVTTERGTAVAETKLELASVAGTYAQLGILDALNQFVAAAPGSGDKDRTPVFVFMSDGEPTAATNDFANRDKTDAIMGNNRVANRDPNETDFLTQLTAAYAKAVADVLYGDETTPLFYTLSLGTSISYDVMDPANQNNSIINGYWDTLISDPAGVTLSYKTYSGSESDYNYPSVSGTCTVKRTTVNGISFPSSANQRLYVDQHFTAEDASDLADTFTDVVSKISLQSRYYPTLVEGGDHNLEGNIALLDQVGEYMQVKEIKGIEIHGEIHTGARLAKNFGGGSGELGFPDQLTAKGEAMLKAVQARLGISDADTAKALVAAAESSGQLSYTSSTEYSNYIGWYADADGKYIGFWDEGVTADPANAAYRIRSYGYLAHVNVENFVMDTDLLYATVQVREEISTGHQDVVFAIPAALIPTVSYDVHLDDGGMPEELAVTGAENPIRLVYEVGLDPAVTADTLQETVSEEYLAANTNADGTVNFYANRYEQDGSVGYNKKNAYSYFFPSHENGRYYYRENTLLFADDAGTVPYTGERPDTEDTLYKGAVVYKKNGNALMRETVYSKAVLTEDNIPALKQNAEGVWYFPADTVHLDFSNYTLAKTENTTETLAYRNLPYVDIEGHNVNDPDHVFVVGATLGNNGRLHIAPAVPLPTPSSTPTPTPSSTPTPTPSSTPMPTPSSTPMPTPSSTPDVTPLQTPAPMAPPGTGDHAASFPLWLLGAAALIAAALSAPHFCRRPKDKR